MPLTLFEKIWNRHVVSEFSDGRALIPVVTVDLERGEIRPPENGLVRFSIPEERRAALLVGLGELDVLLTPDLLTPVLRTHVLLTHVLLTHVLPTHDPERDSFQTRDRSERPLIWGA